jgi:hypothetical protein
LQQLLHGIFRGRLSTTSKLTSSFLYVGIIRASIGGKPNSQALPIIVSGVKLKASTTSKLSKLPIAYIAKIGFLWIKKWTADWGETAA